jgi:hypothetical protein
MAKTAAKKSEPRTSGWGRRRSRVDGRQLDLFAAPTSAPESARFPVDLFDACQVDDKRPISPAAPRVDDPPPSANNDNTGEAETLAAIADLLTLLWQEATGEDLNGAPSIPPQNSYRGKASMARVKAGQPASPSSA